MNNRKPTPESDAARFWAKVDKQGPDDCWPWLAYKERGYGFINIQVDGKGTWMRAHRVSFELANGPIAKGMLIDHLCHNPSCVNPAHLRAATHQQNSSNRAGPNPNSKSGIRGVGWASRAQRWMAYATYMGKRHYGGYFVNIEDAAAAAEALREKLYTNTEAIAAT